MYSSGSVGRVSVSSSDGRQSYIGQDCADGHRSKAESSINIDDPHDDNAL
ncbi:uncharacterized protein PHALS_10135 [Plasmopara halstedii]|uniref:Uncharacterized protein n=1 Tax=Plasmopara halstedii TaxID=4781 RepID=A0A0P1AFN4_PLAHL|nr:uncharacterized protein PHALS_10135 [Plasmopara halstedii]CEG39908.1 hypothetical protein PHALS_10135 [Plasmopara halstedii]|eukprot:XP_024576277.1 hypothetical protein PHALS_10135 [Plasmopara halstedii]